jgi:FtsZ-binding cell division protein ZapB
MSNNDLENFKNKEIERVEKKMKAEYGWIEEKIKATLPKEEDLKDISKVMLAHNIVCLKDELDVITDERDIVTKENERLQKENDRLSEENANLTTLLKR